MDVNICPLSFLCKTLMKLHVCGITLSGIEINWLALSFFYPGIRISCHSSKGVILKFRQFWYNNILYMYMNVYVFFF